MKQNGLMAVMWKSRGMSSRVWLWRQQKVCVGERSAE